MPTKKEVLIKSILKTNPEYEEEDIRRYFDEQSTERDMLLSLLPAMDDYKNSTLDTLIGKMSIRLKQEYLLLNAQISECQPREVTNNSKERIFMLKYFTELVRNTKNTPKQQNRR